MKGLLQKTTVAILLIAFTAVGCSKQQYRSRSKHYPHDAPQKH